MTDKENLLNILCSAATPLAPSDTVRNFVDFLDRNTSNWGLARNVFINNADQATITELNKYKRKHGCIYIFNPAWKKTTIIDRIKAEQGVQETSEPSFSEV